ncbi:MAG: monovalent cation/H+ antiporter subunit D [Lautropia sp.]
MTAPHWIIVPIVLPLATAAAMLLLGEQRKRAKTWLDVGSTFCGLLLSAWLAYAVHHDAGPGGGAVGVYLPSNWPPPFGLVLVLDRLAAALLLLTDILAFGAIVFAAARWNRIGVHFHPLFQILLMGLHGAFLTGDLFNLFVFFEVLLAASYGLLLHAPGRNRVAAGMHYIALNLVASTLFLLGAAMLYGVTGTLNLADLAARVPEVAEGDRVLLHAGAALLAGAFLTKAAIWPLGFWLVPAYAAAGAPVAAVFAVMTKVGIYAIARVGSLMFAGAGAAPWFGADWLMAAGLATVGFGTFGLLASRVLGKLAGFSLIVSSGTLLAALAFGRAEITGGALYYLFSSTLAVAALLLLIELIDRARLLESEHPNPDDADPVPFFIDEHDGGDANANLDEFEQAVIGRAIPAATAFLGLALIGCTLLIVGMPPLAGFIAKFLMLSALLAPGLEPRAALLFALSIASGFAALLALSRTGIRMLWTPRDRPEPDLKVVECLPIAGMLLVCVLITVRAEPVVRYLQTAAQELHRPDRYVAAVFATRPRPGPVSRGDAGLPQGARD